MWFDEFTEPVNLLFSDKRKFVLFLARISQLWFMYEGKSISKLQMDIELKQIRELIWKILLFLNIRTDYNKWDHEAPACVLPSNGYLWNKPILVYMQPNLHSCLLRGWRVVNFYGTHITIKPTVPW
jgi:hypothetical protein